MLGGAGGQQLCQPPAPDQTAQVVTEDAGDEIPLASPQVRKGRNLGSHGGVEKGEREQHFVTSDGGGGVQPACLIDHRTPPKTAESCILLKSGVNQILQCFTLTSKDRTT